MNFVEGFKAKSCEAGLMSSPSMGACYCQEITCIASSTLNTPLARDCESSGNHVLVLGECRARKIDRVIPFRFFASCFKCKSSLSSVRPVLALGSILKRDSSHPVQISKAFNLAIKRVTSPHASNSWEYPGAMMLYSRNLQRKRVVSFCRPVGKQVIFRTWI